MTNENGMIHTKSKLPTLVLESRQNYWFGQIYRGSVNCTNHCRTEFYRHNSTEVDDFSSGIPVHQSGDPGDPIDRSKEGSIELPELTLGAQPGVGFHNEQRGRTRGKRGHGCYTHQHGFVSLVCGCFDRIFFSFSGNCCVRVKLFFLLICLT